METYWTAFYIIVAVLGVVGIASGIWFNPIKKALENLEYYANGKLTEHHSYIPYD